MALSKSQKQEQVTELTKKMSEAQSVIFANYIGLSVAEISELRGKLREANAEMKVAKKTLMNFAAKDAKLPSLEDAELDGPVSLIFSYGDAISGAQIAFKYSKEHNKVALIGGIFDGKLLTKDEALELAKMPSRIELVATFMGMIRSPLVSFASMCNSPLSGFARALDQMAEKGGFADSAPQATQETAPAEPEPAAEEQKPAESPSAEATDDKETPANEEPSPDPAPSPDTTETDTPADSEEDPKEA